MTADPRDWEPAKWLAQRRAEVVDITTGRVYTLLGWPAGNGKWAKVVDPALRTHHRVLAADLRLTRPRDTYRQEAS